MSIPYYNQLRNGLVLSFHVWDGLVLPGPGDVSDQGAACDFLFLGGRPDSRFRTSPRRQISEWRPFHGRRRCRYTINTILADKRIAVPSNYQFLAGAEFVDDMHVRVRLKRVFPAAIEYIAMVLPIWPKAYRERVGAEEYARAPIGAGPYQITKIDPRATSLLSGSRAITRTARKASRQSAPWSYTKTRCPAGTWPTS